eukprot:scaffold238852_cov109-Cyclotella_meneghiniana.AAC.2
MADGDRSSDHGRAFCFKLPISTKDAALTLFVSADEAKTNYSDSAAAAPSLSQIQMNDTESIETIFAPPVDDEEPSAAQPE